MPVGRRSAVESFIGFFVSAEIQREPDAPYMGLRAGDGRCGLRVEFILNETPLLYWRTQSLDLYFPCALPLHYPQHQSECTVWVAQFLANRAFWTINEALPTLE